MGMYRKEWDCCGSITETDSWEPEDCPFCKKLLEQQPSPEPVDFVSLLREADEIVRGKPTWKRFIDGTPLSNDIAVWMTVFAQDVARRSAPPQQPAPEPETCTWFQDGDSDSGLYSTSCRRYFNLEEGTPEDNRMQWCCYCGKKLVQELIVEEQA